MSWLTQLPSIPGAVLRVSRVSKGGGPRRVRVLGIDQPTGLILPSSRLRLEVEAANGSRARWEPAIPIPFPYAWAYRLSRWIGVPVVSTHDPEKLAFSLSVPGLRGSRRRAR